VETDCPFLAPQPRRGQPNEPGYVRFTLEKIARSRGWTLEETEQLTDQNAKRLFRLPD
ncbi:MAG: TatD family hydrolase, partial [Deinococcus sp.]|nr:TatD family hydrolase [Deinococcus sp.]